ncbi:MAG: DUF1819 family protein [Alphaproteobacteria bacterium]|jgi:hypothetical protein|nr:DUF1819 family protein [Alphaproteobacteria bacterium]
MKRTHYTTNLAMGLGQIEETKVLLDAWVSPMNGADLFDKVLKHGLLQNLSANRIKNIVTRCFAPRYLAEGGQTARRLKLIREQFTSPEFSQILFYYTSLANMILFDFVIQIYWEKYASGQNVVSRSDAEAFILRAIDDGKTPSRWSEGQVMRTGRYLVGCCGDFGLLGERKVSDWKILRFEVLPKVFAFLAHDLHFKGLGDNAILSHENWRLFGLERDDVLEEMKKLSLKGLVIIQSAGDVVRISWKCRNMEELCDVLAAG